MGIEKRGELKMNFRSNSGIMFWLMFLFIFNILIVNVSSEDVSKEEMHLVVIDMMNTFLILVSCIFIFAIVNTLRNKKSLDLIRSAHFFKIKEVISAWTLMGSAFLLFSITELIYSFNLVDNMVAHRLFRTLFGILFAMGLFLQYRLLLRYIKQASKKTVRKKRK